MENDLSGGLSERVAHLLEAAENYADAGELEQMEATLGQAEDLRMDFLQNSGSGRSEVLDASGEVLRQMEQIRLSAYRMVREEPVLPNESVEAQKSASDLYVSFSRLLSEARSYRGTGRLYELKQALDSALVLIRVYRKKGEAEVADSYELEAHNIRYEALMSHLHGISELTHKIHFCMYAAEEMEAAGCKEARAFFDKFVADSRAQIERDFAQMDRGMPFYVPKPLEGAENPWQMRDRWGPAIDRVARELEEQRNRPPTCDRGA